MADIGLGHVPVPEQLADGPDIVTVREQVGRVVDYRRPFFHSS
jgi:hypothetical protein